MAEVGYHPATPSSLTSGTPGLTMVRALGPYLPAGPGTLTELHFYVNVGSGRKFRLGIYRTSDATNQPTSLIYSSAELTSTGNAYWHDLTGLSVALTGGPIWLAVWNADTDLGIKYDAPGGTRAYYQTIAYSSAGAWPNPFSVTSSSTSRLAYYGVYTQANEVGYHPTISGEITGAANGANGVPLLFVAGPFTPTAAGTLTELHMYCQAGTGYKVRLCVYADSSGVPGTLLYSSAEQSPSDTSWLDLTGLSVALTGSPIWIGAFSNNGLFSVKYVASTPNLFYSVANTYNSVTAPPSPFPSGTASPVLFDIYGVYTVGGTTYTKTGTTTAGTVPAADRAGEHARSAAATTGTAAATARAGEHPRAATVVAGTLFAGFQTQPLTRDGAVTAAASSVAARAVVRPREAAATTAAAIAAVRAAVRARASTVTVGTHIAGGTVPTTPATVGQILQTETGTLSHAHVGHLDPEGSLA